MENKVFYIVSYRASQSQLRRYYAQAGYKTNGWANAKRHNTEADARASIVPSEHDPRIHRVSIEQV
jgi:hypothetical protein